MSIRGSPIILPNRQIGQRWRALLYASKHESRKICSVTICLCPILASYCSTGTNNTELGYYLILLMSPFTDTNLPEWKRPHVGKILVNGCHVCVACRLSAMTEANQ